jgi:hypothetical protein
MENRHVTVTRSEGRSSPILEQWPRVAPWLAGGLWLVGVAVHVAAAGIGIGAGDTVVAPQTGTVVQYAAGTIAVVSYLTVAVILAVHRPSNAVGWVFAAIGVAISLVELLWGLMLDAIAAGRSADAAAAVWGQPLVGTTLWTFLAFLLFLLFPDGRPISARWGRLVWAAVAATTAMAIGYALTPGPVGLRVTVENPFGVGGPAGSLIQGVRLVGFGVAIGLTLAAVWSTVLRYRAGTHVERQQLKWFAFGSLVFVVVGVAYNTTVELQEANQRVGDVAWIAVCLAAALLPLAAAVGILRYGLFDIDQILSRTFVYGALTAILAGLYTASVRLFNWVFAELTGTESEMALVLSTLLLATTFTPIKKRLEAVVEHRYRDDHDAGDVPAHQAVPEDRAELVRLIREVVAEERAAEAVAATRRARLGRAQSPSSARQARRR